jgi:hypothetical protein
MKDIKQLLETSEKFIDWLNSKNPEEILGTKKSIQNCIIKKFINESLKEDWDIAIFPHSLSIRVNNEELIHPYCGRLLPRWLSNLIIDLDNSKIKDVKKKDVFTLLQPF